MKLEAAVKDYLIEIEIRKYTPRTIKAYRIRLNLFVNWCKESEYYELDDLSMAAIKQFTQHMISKGSKGTYVNSLLKTVKSFIQYSFDEGYGGFNAKRVQFRWVKEDKPVIRAFTTRDVKLMLDNCKGIDFSAIRDTAVLTLFFETGIRCLELCMIQPSDIHDDFIIINGKNHKQRVVPITPVLKKALMRYERVKESYFTFKHTEPYYFLSVNGKQLTNSAVAQMMKRRGSGIKDIRVSPHTCRHFFAQQQIKMGTDLYTISRLLGHENVSITQIYLNSLRDNDIIKIAKQQSVLMNL